MGAPLSGSRPAHPGRAALALFAGVATSAIGYTILIVFAPLAAEDLLGSPRWAGLPTALATTGVALGTSLLPGVTTRHGWRRALVLAYWSGSVAALFGAVAAGLGRFPLMVAGIFAVGGGYSASRLSRYVAADLYDASRRSAAIGWNVWAAALGSVSGPLLLDVTRRGTVALGLPEASGPFLVTAVAFALAGLILRLLFPAALGHPGPDPGTASWPDDDAGRPAGVRLAVVALVVSQVVMVLIMTMTPIHIRHGGLGLGPVGVVLASHTFGMFALSPLVGVVSDRIGAVATIGAGIVLLVASGVLAAAVAPGSALMAFALFLLGLGWCASFVAGSALLTESTPLAHRVRVQGRVDSAVWGAAAAAGLASGVLLSAVGYVLLCVLASVVALAPLVFVRAGLTSATSSRPAPGPAA
ncbi:MAG: MFS transporter [Vicinamibacterales bacterium]